MANFLIALVQYMLYASTGTSTYSDIKTQHASTSGVMDSYSSAYSKEGYNGINSRYKNWNPILLWLQKFLRFLSDLHVIVSDRLKLNSVYSSFQNQYTSSDPTFSPLYTGPHTSTIEMLTLIWYFCDHYTTLVWKFLAAIHATLLGGVQQTMTTMILIASAYYFKNQTILLLDILGLSYFAELAGLVSDSTPLPDVESHNEDFSDLPDLIQDDEKAIKTDDTSLDHSRVVSLRQSVMRSNLSLANVIVRCSANCKECDDTPGDVSPIARNGDNDILVFDDALGLIPRSQKETWELADEKLRKQINARSSRRYRPGVNIEFPVRNMRINKSTAENSRLDVVFPSAPQNTGGSVVKETNADDSTGELINLSLVGSTAGITSTVRSISRLGEQYHINNSFLVTHFDKVAT